MSQATAEPWAMKQLVEGLSAVAARMKPDGAAQVYGQAAAILTLAMSKGSNEGDLGFHLPDLSAVLSREASWTTRQRLMSVRATIVALGDWGVPFTAFALVRPDLEPVPMPLPPQMLVNLLKHPMCVGEPRRLVLAQLSRHYHRPFVDQWDFVDFVNQRNIELDLTSPPERPKLDT
jgi:hypothetical protein